MVQFKYTKSFKHKGINFHKLNYGNWALQSTTYGIISEKHIMYIKQYIQKKIKKFKFFKFNITLNKISTKKPIETRMGGGKGPIYDKQYYIKPGSILLEFHNISFNTFLYISKIINNKISIKLKLIHIN